MDTKMKKVEPPTTMVHPRVLGYYTPKEMLRCAVYFGTEKQWFQAGEIGAVSVNPVDNYIQVVTVPIQVDRNVAIVKACIVDMHGVRGFHIMGFPEAVVCNCGEHFACNLVVAGIFDGKNKEYSSDESD